MNSIDVPERETQATIEAWRAQTFGPAAPLPSALARANEEMAELIRAVTGEKTPAEIVAEAADVAITLCCAAEHCGTDPMTYIRAYPHTSVEPVAVIAIKANTMLAHAMQMVVCDRAEPRRIGIYIDLIAVMMAKLCRSLDFTLDDEVNDKMAINRARKWRLDGTTGHGYHLKLVDGQHRIESA